MGIASFGPICLNPKAKEFGCITTTPKPGWQMVPILPMLLDGIADAKKSEDFRYVFDTDCNVLAKFEL